MNENVGRLFAAAKKEQNPAELSDTYKAELREAQRRREEDAGIAAEAAKRAEVRAKLEQAATGWNKVTAGTITGMGPVCATGADVTPNVRLACQEFEVELGKASLAQMVDLGINSQPAAEGPLHEIPAGHECLAQLIAGLYGTTAVQSRDIELYLANLHYFHQFAPTHEKIRARAHATKDLILSEEHIAELLNMPQSHMCFVLGSMRRGNVRGTSERYVEKRIRECAPYVFEISALGAMYSMSRGLHTVVAPLDCMETLGTIIPAWIDVLSLAFCLSIRTMDQIMLLSAEGVLHFLQTFQPDQYDGDYDGICYAYVRSLINYWDKQGKCSPYLATTAEEAWWQSDLNLGTGNSGILMAVLYGPVHDRRTIQNVNTPMDGMAQGTRIIKAPKLRGRLPQTTEDHAIFGQEWQSELRYLHRYFHWGAYLNYDKLLEFPNQNKRHWYELADEVKQHVMMTAAPPASGNFLTTEASYIGSMLREIKRIHTNYDVREGELMRLQRISAGGTNVFYDRCNRWENYSPCQMGNKCPHLHVGKTSSDNERFRVP
jgi:hypothetical protein